MIEFELKDRELDSAYIEMNRLLKATQVCDSGAMAGVVIKDGLVKFNGFVETQKRKKVRRGDIVEFDGKIIKVV